MCRRCDNTGKKPAARKGKGWPGMLWCVMYTSEAAGATKTNAGSRNHRIIGEEGTKQNVGRKRVTKESDYRSTETSCIFLTFAFFPF